MDVAKLESEFRRVKHNVSLLTAAVLNQQTEIDALTRRCEQCDACAPLPKVRRVTDMRLRHSKIPCVVCGTSWAEPSKAGRMPSRCPSCR